jgi:hypothetical protein
LLARYFRFAENQTNLRQEVLGGLTTFLTMSYIVVVNPRILSQAGMPVDGVVFATCLSAMMGTAREDRPKERQRAAPTECRSTPIGGIRVLAARPLRVRERWTTELFGDYSPEIMLIRVWMRTAVRKEVTSFGTFVSALCHEFCHHLDYQGFTIRGILADSTSARPRYTIMREEHHRSFGGYGHSSSRHPTAMVSVL